MPAGQGVQAELAARGRSADLGGGTLAAGGEQEAGAEAQEAQAGPGTVSDQALCKYWAASGRCPKGGACRYAHPPARGGASGAQQTFAQSRRVERLAAAAAQGFVHEAGDGAKRRRAAVLAEWLVAAYGRDFLNSGTGVMDVAGGRGALTFYLTLQCGVRCTLVEPRRAAALSRQQHRDLAAAGVKAADFHLPQLRVRFGPELWRRDQQHAQASLSPLEEQQQQQQQHLSTWEEEEEEEEAEEAEDQEPEQLEDGQAEADADEVERLLAGCSLVVGLHPDQATDSILDFALDRGKPFAIVPCCVFPRLFPHRRLRQPAAPLDGAGSADSADDGSGRPGSGERSGHSSGAGVSLAAPPLPQPALQSEREQDEGEVVEEEVPVESYTQLLEYLQQRAEDAAGLVAPARRRQQQPQLQQAVAELWDQDGGLEEGLTGQQADAADAAQATAVGSTAGTVLWLEEQAERWEHGGQDGGTQEAWHYPPQGEVPASAAQAALGAAGHGQGTSGPAVGGRYAAVRVAKLSFTGANQVVYALPVEEGEV
ncbi:hypothetical protein HXX76_003624 [Chlamydomonas incerta]|uniref:C3H1-type domain-containing protein n=1 Tax=Chlamydomonas incerta TaxID=51695 RepID=A0A835T8R6_CHLIN|nr:hypothetical protein HXX76_003624 [Chlamydomonas incerta]|eukprot:KAG2440768.1 hypothetical protein HXX76_003624 [Chlamydomonas incerta]